LSSELTSADPIKSLHTKALYVVPTTGLAAKSEEGITVASPVCHFANLEIIGGKGNQEKGTLLLENPIGETLTVEQLKSQVNILIQLLTGFVLTMKILPYIVPRVFSRYF